MTDQSGVVDAASAEGADRAGSRDDGTDREAVEVGRTGRTGEASARARGVDGA
jgi:hypothetical protein